MSSELQSLSIYRRLTLQLFALQFMVLSGLMLQRVFSRAAITLVWFFCIIGVRAQPADVAGTMPEDYLPQLKPILAQALQTAPEIIGKRFDQLLQEVRVEEARSARLPQVGGNFNYGVTQSATRSNANSQDRSSGFYYNFGASQALWHWGALKNHSEAARLSLLAAEKSYAQFYRTISNSIRKAYLALVVEKAMLRQKRALFEIVRQDVAVADAKFSTGSISAASRESERFRLRENELAIRRGELEFETNRRRFARLVGLTELGEADVADQIPQPAHSESRTTAMAAAVLRENAKSTWEAEYWDLRVREAELAQKIAATRLLPKFGASANYSLENNTYVNGNSVQQNAVTRESVGIGGNWPIFDGFATRAAKRQALLAKRALEHTKAVKIEELLENVQSLERKLKADADLFEIVTGHKAIAEANQKLATEEANLGNIPKSIVAGAAAAVLLADAKNFEARAAYLSDWCEFVAVAGDDPVMNNLPARYARAKK
jgi:outer membrane protein TolC